MACRGRRGENCRSALAGHRRAHGPGQLRVGGEILPRCGIAERTEPVQPGQHRAPVLPQSDPAGRQQHAGPTACVQVGEAASDCGQYSRRLAGRQHSARGQQVVERAPRRMLDQARHDLPPAYAANEPQVGRGQRPRNMVGHQRRRRLGFRRGDGDTDSERQNGGTAQLPPAHDDRRTPAGGLAGRRRQRPWFDQPPLRGRHQRRLLVQVDRPSREEAHATIPPSSAGTATPDPANRGEPARGGACEGRTPPDRRSVHLSVPGPDKMLA